MSYVIAFEHFFFMEMRKVYATHAPCFTVNPDKAHHFTDRREAVRQREQLAAKRGGRSPERDYRIEEHTGE